MSQGSGPTTPLLPGDPERIGGYTLLGRLGGGGMGTVFLARSAGGRVVALKTVHEHLAREPEFRIRFRLEAEAARTIGARHGATVVAADTQGALPWLATEYLLGPSLAEAVVRHGPLPETAVRALGSRLAQALADIHGSGLVHRDLKPSNVLVTAAGPRVIDFGIARALGARRLTRTGQAVGTPAYMSPEQAGGRDHEPPGDVFALAGVLVFAATGHAPFAGEAAADLLYGVRYGTPDFSGLPAGLLPVLLRCLAKDPDDRPADEEIAAELGGGEGNFADLLPGPLRSDLGRRAVGVWDLRPTRLPGPPPPPEEPPAGWTSRRRLLLAGAGGLLALGAGAALWAARGSSGTPPADRKAASTSPRPPGLPPEPLWTYDAESLCRVEAVRDGIVVVSVGDDRFSRTVAGLDAATGKVAWRSPKTVVFEENGEGLVVREKSSVLNAPDPLLALSPTDGRLTEYPAELGQPRLLSPRLIARTDDRLYLSGYDGHQQLIAAYAADGGTRLWAQKTGHEPSSPSPGVAAAGDVLIYSVSGDVVGVGRDDGRERWRIDLSGPDNLRLQPVHPASLADGRLHLGGGEVRALEAATGKVVWRFGADRVPYPGGRASFGTPTAVDGMVYVIGLRPAGAQNPRVYDELLALRASDGALQWTYAIPDGVRFDPPPLLHRGMLYVDTGKLAQPLLAVGLATRRPPWTYRSGFTEDGHVPLTTSGYTDLRIADGRLHLSCGTHVLALPAQEG
ncbi:serine/threonine-protein kinase [Streptomyces sp. NBC_00335]|uniref:serine/threonine-protein kinase n=1 Tax=unclassified Streptomyces TaxID=2593676 RepID=UPI00225009C8|nr:MULTISPECIES: serine/threonine-protein kinase [unclassified Streptomyces]MCX5409740.1 serine/threonine-protein kinase [Streptomyces sp. NBC_00086]